MLTLDEASLTRLEAQFRKAGLGPAVDLTGELGRFAYRGPRLRLEFEETPPTFDLQALVPVAVGLVVYLYRHAGVASPWDDLNLAYFENEPHHRLRELVRSLLPASGLVDAGRRTTAPGSQWMTQVFSLLTGGPIPEDQFRRAVDQRAGTIGGGGDGLRTLLLGPREYRWQGQLYTIVRMRDILFGRDQNCSARWDTLLRAVRFLRFEEDGEDELRSYGYVTALPQGFRWDEGPDGPLSRTLEGPFDLLQLSHCASQRDNVEQFWTQVERGEGVLEVRDPPDFLTDRFRKLCRDLAAHEPGTEVWVEEDNVWVPGLTWRPRRRRGPEPWVRPVPYQIRSRRPLSRRSAIWFHELTFFLTSFQHESGLRQVWAANDWFVRKNVFVSTDEKLDLLLPGRPAAGHQGLS